MEENQNAQTSKKSPVSTGLVAMALIALVGIGAITIGLQRKNTAQAPASATNETTQPVVAGAMNQKYKDGSFTATGIYTSPAGAEAIKISLQLKDGIIQDAGAIPLAEKDMSKKFQGLFSDNFGAMVIGKSLDEVALTKVSGSSLTSTGFMDAVEKIRTQAAG